MTSGGVRSSTPRRSRVRVWRDIAKLMLEFWRAHRLASIGMTLVTLVGNARTGIMVVAMGGVVDAAIAGSGASLLFWFSLFIGAAALEQVYWSVVDVLGSYLHDRGAFLLRERVFLRAAAAPLIQFEESNFFDHMQRATSGVGAKLHQLFFTLLKVFVAAVSLVSVGAALLLVQPILIPILLLGTFPSVWLELRVAGLTYQVQREHTTPDRMRGHLRRLLTGRSEAAEVRLFGTSDYLLGEWRKLRERRKEDMLAAEFKRTLANLGGTLLSTASYIAALVLVTLAIRDGELSTGDFVTVATGALWFRDSFFSLIQSIRSAEEDSLFLGDLFDFLEQARVEGDTGVDTSHCTPVESNSGLEPGQGMSIQVEDITFTYPAGDSPTIRNVSLSIAPGERIAIVGDNGAGKSTLVKLLIGLYLPDHGCVKLNGEPVTAASAPRLRRRIAPVFQDYAKYLLTARENIAFGDTDRLHDTEAVAYAAVQAEIAPFIERLPEGYETFLGREFGQVDLSGGQWQRLALARAFFRDADLLVLDEPTAALDPKAELALFERFIELVEGRTAIMVSHRLGMCRLADRIVVMEDGRIVESGTHDELLRLGGRYAAFFSAQAQWYQ